MNKIVTIITGVASVMLLFQGCAREIDDPVSGHNCSTTLQARMELGQYTKTTLSKPQDGVSYPLWASKDTLAVFTEKGQRPTPFLLNSGAGTTSGSFEGALVGDHYYTLFPYRSKVRWDGDKLVFRLSDVQIYQPDSFASSAFPMIAESETNELQFKNLCSILQFSITGDAMVRSITLTSETHYLSGEVSVEFPVGDSPAISFLEGGKKTVTLECGAVKLSKEKATDFYIVIPSGDYDGLTISVDAITDSVTKTISHEFAIKRSELRPIAPFAVEAPQIDLDNLPDNQIWYKTKSGRAITFDYNTTPPFDVKIISNTYQGEYGIIVFDAPVKIIDRGAFDHDGEDIVELHLPDCVEVIESYALPKLESFRVPGSLTRFYNYWNLSGKRIGRIYGPLVASDGKSVVRDGVLLAVLDGDWEEYVTPPEVKQMTEYCLGYTSIKSLVISEGVEKIEPIYIWGDGIWVYAPELETVTLPESLTYIDCMMSNAPKLKGFYGSPRCTSEDHLCLISPRSGTLVSVVEGVDQETLVIPEGVTFFWAYINNWPNLKKIRIPASMDNILHGRIMNCPKFEGFQGPGTSEDGRCIIENGALIYFYGKGLEEYTTPSEVKTVRKFVFEPGLKKLVINEGVKILDPLCFQYATDLKELWLPSSIRIISDNILRDDVNIESVYLPSLTPPEVYGPPHTVTLSKLKLYVPEEALEAYRSNEQWALYWGEYLEGYHFDSPENPEPDPVDYSQDGLVTVLQTATEGNGIDLVLMGDAYTDKDIADGTYLKKMEAAAEAFFELEPYHSFRHLYNVYVVNAISPSDFVWSDPTVFESKVFDNAVYANNDKCIEYALKAIPDERLDEASILVVVNTPYSFKDLRSGATSMWTRSSTRKTDYGSGIGLAFVTSTFEFNTLVHHEMGHAFAKLDDEYISRAWNDEPIPNDVKERKQEQSRDYGWWKNTDYTPDPTKVKWAKFLSDARYENEKLGVFEGAGASYLYGIYRPSYKSTMNDNVGGFNAPSREAIYYRIHKLAYGDEWQYDFEDFVRWDQGAKNIHPTSVGDGGPTFKEYEIRQPLPVTKFNREEWTVTEMMD
jgi:hypothetical protein